MMSFPDTVSGLLRTLAIPLRAIRGSTYRTHEAGGGGSSGADFYAAEFELQPWSATPTTSQDEYTTVATHSAPRSTCHEIHQIRLPELPRPVIIHARRETAPCPIIRAASFDSIASTSSQDNTRTSNISERRATTSNCDDGVHRQVVSKKQQASEVCWREYWG
ncbi:hypothetical protein F4804DRAFT_10971 [Jackrogersella minutella]|nr:hypothetical protein F4804DRAFT_10971 [Jackrogersella minutella]